MDDGFCSRLSLAAGESIVATASAGTTTWLVLEHTAPWGAKAFEQAELPTHVRAAMESWAGLAGARIQLVRRDRPPDHVSFFLGWSAQGTARVIEVQLGCLDELPDLDVPAAVDAMVRGDAPAIGRELDRPLLLVCTNGKRDRCCAKWGLELFDALGPQAAVSRLQTTHLGGHRFAATSLLLPDGLCFGRLEASDSVALAESIAARHIFRLDRFRGRTCLSEPEQAAEHALREHTGAMGFDDVHVRGSTELGDGRHAVELDGPSGAVRIELRCETSDRLAPTGCGKPPEPLGFWRTLSIS